VPGSIVAAEADAGAISDDELAADGEADSGEAASEVELEEDEFEADELEEVEFESGEGAAVALAPIADEGATLCGGAWPWAKLLRLRPAKTTPNNAVWKRLMLASPSSQEMLGNVRRPSFQPAIPANIGCRRGS
jgi:hypothetical protein